MFKMLVGAAEKKLLEIEPASVQCVVTSPPFPHPGDDLDQFVDWLAGGIMGRVRDVLASSGTVWLVMAECRDQFGELRMLGARTALAMMTRGWHLQSEIVWWQPNATRRDLKRPIDAHEKVFVFSKSRDFYLDPSPPSKISSSEYLVNVWRIPQDEYWQFLQWRSDELARGRVFEDVQTGVDDAHYGAMPPALAALCVQAGSLPGAAVLDPFAGSGTVPIVAQRMGRKGIGIDLRIDVAMMARRSIEESTTPGAIVEAR